MKRMSGHRVRTAAHHVLLFVQKPSGLSGTAHGPGKVLPLRPAGAGGEARPSPPPAFTWGLVVLGAIILGAMLVVGFHVGRQFVFSRLIGGRLG